METLFLAGFFFGSELTASWMRSRSPSQLSLLLLPLAPSAVCRAPLPWTSLHPPVKVSAVTIVAHVL
jgi:hypothetical protein